MFYRKLNLDTHCKTETNTKRGYLMNKALSSTLLLLESQNKALSSTLLLLQSQNKALQALSSAISRMESRLKKKREQQKPELAATADSSGSR